MTVKAVYSVAQYINDSGEILISYDRFFKCNYSVS